LSHMYIGVCEKNSDEMINSLSSASFSGRWLSLKRRYREQFYLWVNDFFRITRFLSFNFFMEIDHTEVFQYIKIYWNWIFTILFEKKLKASLFNGWPIAIGLIIYSLIFEVRFPAWSMASDWESEGLGFEPQQAPPGNLWPRSCQKMQIISSQIVWL